MHLSSISTNGWRGSCCVPANCAVAQATRAACSRSKMSPLAMLVSLRSRSSFLNAIPASCNEWPGRWEDDIRRRSFMLTQRDISSLCNTHVHVSFRIPYYSPPHWNLTKNSCFRVHAQNLVLYPLKPICSTFCSDEKLYKYVYRV